MGLNTENLLAIISIILLSWNNTRGLNAGKSIQNIFTFTKLISLVVLILVGISFGRNHEAISLNLQSFWDTSWTKMLSDGKTSMVQLSGLAIYAAVGAAMVGSLFSSDAWNNITFTAGEVINPKKNIPLSLALGVGIVTFLYILINITYLLVLPLHGDSNGADIFSRGIQFALQDRVATAVMQQIFGASGAIIMALLIMISTFGCNNGIILAGARVYYAMAKDKLFFKFAVETNKNSVPEKALLVQCIWSCVLCLSGAYSDLLDYVMFPVIVFYVLTIYGLFVLRRKMPDIERPYKAFGYPLLPAVYIVFGSLISMDLLIYKPNYTWPGLLIVMLGIPVYFIWKLINKPVNN